MSATAGSLLSLPPAKWLEKLKNYVQLTTLKKETAAEAAAAEQAHKAAKGELLLALGTATAARCGSAVVTVKEGKPAEASLTLASGRKIKFSAVTAVLVGNEQIKAGEIVSIYGGRDGSVTVEVAGI